MFQIVVFTLAIHHKVFHSIIQRSIGHSSGIVTSCSNLVVTRVENTSRPKDTAYGLSSHNSTTSLSDKPGHVCGNCDLRKDSRTIRLRSSIGQLNNQMFRSTGKMSRKYERLLPPSALPIQHWYRGQGKFKESPIFYFHMIYFKSYRIVDKTLAE